MKEQKKQYRQNYEELKKQRGEVYYIQQSIDALKQQLVSAFEDWYVATFEQEEELLSQHAGGHGSGQPVSY